MTPLADENQFHKSLRNAGVYITSRKPIVKPKLISVYVDCLLEFGEWDIHLGLTLSPIKSEQYPVTSAVTGKERELRECPCVQE